jgi:hypothetical protein
MFRGHPHKAHQKNYRNFCRESGMFRVLNKSLRVPELGAFQDRSAFALEVAPLMKARVRYGGTRSFAEEKGYEREESGR